MHNVLYSIHVSVHHLLCTAGILLCGLSIIIHCCVCDSLTFQAKSSKPRGGGGGGGGKKEKPAEADPSNHSAGSVQKGLISRCARIYIYVYIQYGVVITLQSVV